MKYVVVGQNRDTGARMSLEFEAESKGAAERKAGQAGMSVRHVTEVTDPVAGSAADGPALQAQPAASPAREYRPVRASRGGGGLIRLLLLVVIVAALAWYFWPQIRSFLPR